MGRQRRLLWCLCCVITAGLASRMVHSGLPLLDKYAGDGLYAVMVYLLAALLFKLPPCRLALGSMLFMTLLETFQLTGIPLAMATSGNLFMKLAGRLIGTTFSPYDLAFYAVGIGAVLCMDYYLLREHSLDR